MGRPPVAHSHLTSSPQERVMGLVFDTILTTLGFGGLVRHDKPATPAPADSADAAAPAAPGTTPAPGGTATAAPPKGIPVVDVVSQLESRAAAYPHKLNWRYSIVDLLTLIGVDSSYSARKELAVELGCPTEKMDDSAEMNTWLHKEVLRRLAANGGNVPQDLLD
jgi:hypothetical protein